MDDLKNDSATIPSPFIISATEESESYSGKSRLRNLTLAFPSQTVPFPFENRFEQCENVAEEEEVIAEKQPKLSDKSCFQTFVDHRNELDTEESDSASEEEKLGTIERLRAEVKQAWTRLSMRGSVQCRKCSKKFKESKNHQVANQTLQTHVGCHFDLKTHVCSLCRQKGSYAAISMHTSRHHHRKAKISINNEPKCWNEFLEAFKECYLNQKEANYDIKYIKDTSTEESIEEENRSNMDIKNDGMIGSSEQYKELLHQAKQVIRTKLGSPLSVSSKTRKNATHEILELIKTRANRICKRNAVRCKICKKKFDGARKAPTSILRHVGCHFKIRTHLCPFCSYVGSYNGIRQHIPLNHAQKSLPRKSANLKSWKDVLDHLKSCFISAEIPSKRYTGRGISRKMTGTKIKQDKIDPLEEVKTGDTKKNVCESSQADEARKYTKETIGSRSDSINEIRRKVKILSTKLKLLYRDRKELKCLECMREVKADETILWSHVGTHFKAKTHSCRVCPYYGSQGGARIHMFKKHEIRADPEENCDPEAWRILLLGLQRCFPAQDESENLCDATNSLGSENSKTIDDSAPSLESAAAPNSHIFFSYPVKNTTGLEKKAPEERGTQEVIKKTCKLCASLLPQGVLGDIFTEHDTMLAHVEIHRNMSLKTSEDFFSDCFG